MREFWDDIAAANRHGWSAAAAGIYARRAALFKLFGRLALAL